MSFADALSATASTSYRLALDRGVAAFVDKFKKKCQDKAKEGFFLAEETYAFSVEVEGAQAYPVVHYNQPNAAGVVLKQCVAEKKDKFRSKLEEEINALGFKQSTCTIAWPGQNPQMHPHLFAQHSFTAGSITINAKWPPEPAVKRERAASPQTDGRRVRSRS